MPASRDVQPQRARAGSVPPPGARSAGWNRFSQVEPLTPSPPHRPREPSLASRPGPRDRDGPDPHRTCARNTRGARLGSPHAQRGGSPSVRPQADRRRTARAPGSRRSASASSSASRPRSIRRTSRTSTGSQRRSALRFRTPPEAHQGVRSSPKRLAHVEAAPLLPMMTQLVDWHPPRASLLRRSRCHPLPGIVQLGAVGESAEHNDGASGGVTVHGKAPSG